MANLPNLQNHEAQSSPHPAAGNNTEVLFNDNSVVAGDSNFTWNKTTKINKVTGGWFEASDSFGFRWDASNYINKSAGLNQLNWYTGTMSFNTGITRFVGSQFEVNGGSMALNSAAPVSMYALGGVHAGDPYHSPGTFIFISRYFNGTGQADAALGFSHEAYSAAGDNRIHIGTNLFTFDSGGNFGIGITTPQEKLAVAGNMVLPKTAGDGIKVDNTTPTFGWRDLLGNITNAGGANKPTNTTYRGGITQFKFGAGDEAILEYHIPHDYVPGTDIFLHVHWSHTSAIVTGGTLTFTAESSYSKGHNQAPFSAPVTGTFTGTASTAQYQHIISETQFSASSPSGLQIDTDDLEPDGVILVRLEMTTNNITSSGAVPDPFIHFIDVHYQSTNIATKDKAPNFYT